MIYKGSCHCGKIAFEVEGDLEQVIQCNCSICSKRGFLLWFLPRANFRLLTPQENLATYTFNKHKIKHHFCQKCGCAPFGEATNPKGEAMAVINTRCLDDVDLSVIPVRSFNGRDL
jgi:hypothetical protein